MPITDTSMSTRKSSQIPNPRGARMPPRRIMSSSMQAASGIHAISAMPSTHQRGNQTIIAVRGHLGSRARSALAPPPLTAPDRMLFPFRCFPLG